MLGIEETEQPNTKVLVDVSITALHPSLLSSIELELTTDIPDIFLHMDGKSKPSPFMMVCTCSGI